MANNLNKVSGNVIIYSIGNILLKIVGLLLLPIYTTVFRISEFGVIGIIETTSLLLTTILSFSLSAALLRWLSDKNDLDTEKSIVFTVFSITVFIILVFSSLTFPFLKSISLLLFKTDLYKSLILLMFINVYIDVINRIPLCLIRVREKPILYVISIVFKAIITLGINIILLKYTSLGITAVLIGGIAGNLFFFLCTAPLLLQNIHVKFLKSEVSGLLKFSYPLIIASLGSIMLNFSDRYVLGFLKDYGQVVIYTLAYKVASVVNMFVLQAVNLAIIPVALKAFASEEGKTFLKQILTYFTVVLCVMFLILSIFSMDVLKIFSRTDDYLSANHIIPLLVFAFVFDGLRLMYGVHITYVKKTQWHTYITLTSCAINVGLNLLVIPKYGYFGAAITTLLTSLLNCFAYQRVSQSLIYVKYEHLKIYLIIAYSLICFGVYKLLEYIEIGNIFTSLLLIIVYVATLWWLKIIKIKDFMAQ